MLLSWEWLTWVLFQASEAVDVLGNASGTCDTTENDF